MLYESSFVNEQTHLRQTKMEHFFVLLGMKLVLDWRYCYHNFCFQKYIGHSAKVFMMQFWQNTCCLHTYFKWGSKIAVFRKKAANNFVQHASQVNVTAVLTLNVAISIEEKPTFAFYALTSETLF